MTPQKADYEPLWARYGAPFSSSWRKNTKRYRMCTIYWDTVMMAVNYSVLPMELPQSCTQLSMSCLMILWLLALPYHQLVGSETVKSWDLWYHSTWSILVTVMPCFQMATSHYLNQRLIYHQYSLMAFTWGQYPRNAQHIYHWCNFEKY